MHTLVELLQHRARTAPPGQGYRYLLDGEADGPHDDLSFVDLDRRAQLVAAELQRQQARPGDRALLLYPPGLEYLAGFFGCLYAGVVAVPAYPPEPSRLARTLPRMQAILADAEAAFVLTTEALRGSLASSTSSLPRPPRWIATDRLDGSLAEAWRDPDISENSLAFLQYTSGSTSSPKGVMVSHRNLLHTLEDMGVDWGHDERSVLVSWLPVFHDLGLIYGLLQPVFGGFRGVLFSPVAFLQRPVRWLQAISRFGGTHSAAPNFAFDLCVRKSTERERASLDLSTWRVALNAAEPVRAETIERFNGTFAPCGLSATTVTPGYGLAEATLKVSTVRASDRARLFHADPEAMAQGRAAAAPGEASRPLVGCGRPALGAVVEIVDPETLDRVAEGVVGEIWVASRSVAGGYWNRPDESRETFGATLPGSGHTFLRTGDLGFVSGGELFLTGRLKDLLIVDGKNHYPQDIELTAERAHPALRPGCGAAFSVDQGGEERVVLVHEVDPQKAPDLDAAAAQVRAAVFADHQLPLHALVFLKPGAIAKTSSGKIQRRASRASFLSQQLEPLFLWSNAMEEKQPKKRTQDAIERWLYTEIGKTLSVHPSDLEPKKSLEELGLKSSQILSLTSQLEAWLGRRLEQNSLTEGSSIPDIAKALAS